MTGFVGAATVAMWFLAVDLIAGSPFHTPSVLGSALILGVASDWVVEELGWVTVFVANVLAVVGMGGWVWRGESFRAS